VRILFNVILISFFLCLLGVSVAADAGPGRFFLAGDGEIRIRNVKTEKEVEVNLLNPDGSLNEAGFSAIDEVFGFPTREKGEHISPRLIFMMDYFSDLAAPGKAIQLTSGYRSPDYNDALREAGGNVARTSQHIDGLAADFYLDGVDGKALWELIRSRDCCGVGHYGGAMIHLDAARPRFWEAATSGTETRVSEHNRKIFLSTDYDRYRPGDPMRLSFSTVSDFGFGIRSCAAIVAVRKNSRPVATVQVILNQEDENGPCLRIGDRKTSRFIHLALPSELPPGRYRVRVDFCDRPFDDMPLQAVSNELEVPGAP
jgi:uncharacterized protein YcbK (DUF882 family)